MAKAKVLFIALATVLLVAVAEGGRGGHHQHHRHPDGGGGHGNSHVCEEEELNTCLDAINESYDAPTTCDDVQQHIQLHAACYANTDCCHRRWRAEHASLKSDLTKAAGLRNCDIPWVHCRAHGDDNHEDHRTEEDPAVDENGREITSPPGEANAAPDEVSRFVDELGVELSRVLEANCDVEELQSCVATAESGRDAAPADCEQAEHMLSSLARCFGETGCCLLWEGLRDSQLNTWAADGGASNCRPSTTCHQASDEITPCDRQHEFQTAAGGCAACAECEEGFYAASRCGGDADTRCAPCPDQACTTRVAVAFSTTLPFASPAAFAAEEELAFRHGVARAVGVPVDDVTVTAVTGVGRRRSVAVGKPFSGAGAFTCDAALELAMGGRHYAFCAGQLWQVPLAGRRAGPAGIEVLTQVAIRAERAEAVTGLTLEVLNDGIEEAGGVLALTEIEIRPDQADAVASETDKEEEEKQAKKQPKSEQEEEEEAEGYSCNFGSADLGVTLGLIGAVFALLFASICLCRRTTAHGAVTATIPSATARPLPPVTAMPTKDVFDGATTGVLVLAVTSGTDTPSHGESKEVVAGMDTAAIEVAESVDSEPARKSADKDKDGPGTQTASESHCAAATMEGTSEETG